MSVVVQTEVKKELSMLQNNCKADIIISCDETQMNHIGNVSLPSESFVGNSYTIKIKKKRHRTAFTTDQLLVLENAFSINKYIDRQKRKKLADRLMIGEKNIKVWFQNRRMKNKRLSDSSDSSSDGNDSMRINSSRSSEDIQLPAAYSELPTSGTNDMNFYPQCNDQQTFAYTDYRYQPYYDYNNYHHNNYQYYNVNYSNYNYNQFWPQQYTNLCQL